MHDGLGAGAGEPGTLMLEWRSIDFLEADDVSIKGNGGGKIVGLNRYVQ